MAADLCNFFKFGHCKFGDRCKKTHVKEKCNNASCETLKCAKRHPIECKYYKEFGRCKFGVYCDYDHSSTSNADVLQSMASKITSLETEKIEMQEKITELEAKLTSF